MEQSNLGESKDVPVDERLQILPLVRLGLRCKRQRCDEVGKSKNLQEVQNQVHVQEN